MLTPGQIIDEKYRIVRLIGEGGMGAVYEGENVRIHRRVAIKVLHLGIAKSQDIVARFEREAQAAGRIGSDHIVEVLDLGNLSENERFMVMEYLEGEHLGARIQARGRLSPEESSAILIQLLEGLGAAHAVGIFHRDLKPENVFLLRGKKGAPDFVKILDFGISKFNALGGDSMSMTRTGTVMGTPYYMSPEQARGLKGIDHRSDIYSVGVILYEALTGQVPYRAESFNELIFKIALETPIPAEQIAVGLDPKFAAIVSKGMARDPEGRFQSAADFAQALSDWLESVKAGGRVGPGQSPVMAEGTAQSPTNPTPQVWGQATPQPGAGGAAGWGQATPQPGAGGAAGWGQATPQPRAGSAAEWGQATPAPRVGSAAAWGQATPKPGAYGQAALGAGKEEDGLPGVGPRGRSRASSMATLAVGGLVLGSVLAVAATRLLRKPEIDATPAAAAVQPIETVPPTHSPVPTEHTARIPVPSVEAAPAESSAPSASAVAEVEAPAARKGNAPGATVTPRVSKARTPGQGTPAPGVTAGGRKIRTEL